MRNFVNVDHHLSSPTHPGTKRNPCLHLKDLTLGFRAPELFLGGTPRFDCAKTYCRTCWEVTVEFETWYANEHPRLLATLILLTGDGDAARDATDEAFTRAYQHWRKVSAMESPTGWLVIVGRNIARRQARRRSSERRLLRRVSHGQARSVPAAAGEAWMLVAELPERQRVALVLRYVADLTEPEIGRVMGTTRGTVSRTLRDALHSLRQQLDDETHTKDSDP